MERMRSLVYKQMINLAQAKACMLQEQQPRKALEEPVVIVASGGSGQQSGRAGQAHRRTIAASAERPMFSGSFHSGQALDVPGDRVAFRRDEQAVPDNFAGRELCHKERLPALLSEGGLALRGGDFLERNL